MNGNQYDRRYGVGSDPLSSEKSSQSELAVKTHSFISHGRSSMSVSGVMDVVSFDDTGVLLVTTCGRLSLEGTDLHVTVLNTRDGMVEVSGKLYSLFYDDPDDSSRAETDKHKGKRGFFGRFLS